MKKNPKVFKHARVPAKLRFVCLVLLLASFAMTAQAGLGRNNLFAARFLPPQTISGRVTDAKNIPMEGVTVTIKGTNRGVTTNALGNFTFPNVPDNATLVFSFTGFGSVERAVRAGQNSMNIILNETISGLNDVVVVGYGTRTKKDLTGAVVQVKAAQFENENPRSVGDLLRGNAPGLDVGFDGTTKGSNSSLQVRGRGSLTASTSPLIVLDGVIYPGGLEDINPNDIGTIDILKDASSAAVFGARSANGVILITTKKGKSGKPVITFNDNIGLNKAYNMPHLLNGYEMIDFRSQFEWAARGFDSTSKPGIKYRYWDPSKLPSDISVAQWMALENSTGDPNTVWLNRLEFKPVEIANIQAGKMLDWKKLIFNQNALQHDHTISVSQRKEDYNYYFSVGYLENQGLTNGDKYKTFRTRLNLESKVAKFLTVGINTQFAERDESSVPLSLSDVLGSTPWGSIYADGSTTTLRNSVNDDPGNNTNPFMGQYYTSRMYKYDNFFANAYVKGDLPYGFSYSVNFAPRFELIREYNFQSDKNPTILAKKGVIDRRNQTLYAWTLDNVLSWNKKYGKHSVSATFLVNAEKFQSWNTTVHAENLQPNGNLGYNSLQAATATPIVNSDDQYATGDALMGRINYNYDQKYFLTLTTRRDGYSAFGQQNPRANFPSVAVAWAFSDERFMKNTDRWLDYAKLRVSYGENGNRDIGRYAALSNLTSGTYTFVTSGGVVYSGGQVSASNLSNPELKWERNSSVNIGLDFSILKGIVSGTVEYYNRRTKDLLVNRALPTVTGFSSILANLGEVKNTGMEFSFNTNNMKRRNFEWRSTLAFWFNKNEIIHLYGATPDYDATGKQIGTSEKDDLTNKWFIGHNISAIYDYKIIGVWGTAEAATAAKYGFKPGDFKIQDTNGDGAYTIADRIFQGNRDVPSLNVNLRNEFRIFSNFDFSFTLYGKFGQYAQFNQAKNVDRFYNRSNFYSRPYWTPSNQIQDYAAINSNAGGGITWDVWRRSSFVRLSNVSLAYTVPADITRRLKFDAIKVYVNVVNAAVFSSWKYFDPEYHGTGAGNLPTNETPVPTTYNFGLNITL